MIKIDSSSPFENMYLMKYQNREISFKFTKAVEENKHYNILNQMLTSRNRTEYFLCFNQLEGGNYFEEQGIKFISYLNKLKQKFYLEVRLIAPHGKNHGLSESINLFKKYAND